MTADLIAPLSDAEIVALLPELEVYALTLFGEAKNQGRQGIRAVSDVVDNRHKAKPRLSHRAICLARAQFSCWSPIDGPENYADLMDMARRVVRKADNRGPIFAICMATAASRLAQPDQADTVMGATHYVTEWMWRNKPPKHLIGQRPVCQIGDHVFFAGIAW